VGAYTDAKGTTHGYLLSGGQYSNVDDPNGVTNFALGINASGLILGNYTDASGVSHGFLLSHGQYTTFDDPNGVSTLAGGINNSGQVVGTYLDANNVFHAFLLSGGQYTTLDDPNAGTGAFQGTLAYGINDAGKIVGFYYDANNVVHGFLATPAHANAFGASIVSAANGSQGHGIGGGVYSLGAFSRDIATVMKHNHDSTSNDDIFP
jgi:probable HAF family extracellular repeat protein